MLRNDFYGRRADNEVPQRFLLNPAVTWPSRLKDIYINEQEAAELDYSLSQLIQSAEFRELDTPKQIRDVEHLEKALEALVKAGTRAITPPWFRYGLQIVLSPDRLRAVLNGRLDSRNLDYSLISDPDHPTALLFVNPKGKPARIKRHVEYALGPAVRDALPVHLAPANSDYAIEINANDMPFAFRGDHHESKMLVFSATEYLRDQVPPSGSLREYLEQQFDVDILRSRPMSSHEKKWLATWLRDPKIEHHELLVLEFDNTEDRNFVSRMQHVPIYLVEGVIDEKKVYEDAILQVYYDLRMTLVVGVRLVVHKEQDIEEAGQPFNELGCRVVWRLRENAIEIFAIPSHLQTHDDKLWFVEKICEDKNIRFTRTELIWRNRVSTKVPSEDEIKTHIDKCFWDITREVGIMPFENLLDRNVDLTNSPWFKVPRMDDQHLLNVMCYFETGEKGLRVLREVMKPDIMRRFSKDAFVPIITPIYRRFVTISRNMRAVFHAKIAEFDEKIRMKFYNLSKQNDALMEQPSSYYCALRVYEKWEEHEERGFIGIEGWQPLVVGLYLKELQTLLEPVVFDENEELLHGIGELYAKQLEKKWRVLVDVDKFEGKISVFGDDVALAMEDLRNYATSKRLIEVKVDINGKFINGFDHITEGFWHDAGLYDFKWFLWPYERIIEFEGTIEVYEKLIGALNKYSRNVLERCMQRRDVPVEQSCPICFSKIEGRDWYRQTCGHLLCRDCANGQFRADAQGRRFNCKVCEKNWAPMDVKRIILGGQNRLLELDTQKLQKVVPLFHNALITLPHLDIKSCPTPDCLGILRPGSAEQHCSICWHAYCGSCLHKRGDAHQCPPPGGTIVGVDEETKEYLQRLTKQCTACGSFVQKNGGCEHIECPCGAHFCYLCGFNARTARKIYSHMRTAHMRNDLVLDEDEYEVQFIDPQMEEEHMLAMIEFYNNNNN